MTTRHLYFLAVAAMLLASCKSQQPANLAQPRTIEAQGSYLHAPSGMVFPPSIAGFQRVNVTQYDATGLDVSAGYNLPMPAGGGIAATFYVYPAPSLVSIGSPPEVVGSTRVRLCVGEFERRQREVAGHHPGARLIAEKDAMQRGPSIPGKMATFEYDDFFGGQRQPLHSELFVFCYVGDKWALEYRFTWPKSFDGADAVSNFMIQLR